MSDFETFDSQNGILVLPSYREQQFSLWRATGGMAFHEISESHYGAVYGDDVEIECRSGRFSLQPGMVFCVKGPLSVEGKGKVFGISAVDFDAFFQVAGPIEEKGRLRYIDGCTDSLILSPMKMGDPCLNHLHFPSGIDQSKHTHPSFRAGLIIRGRGICKLDGADVGLEPGMIFHLPEDVVHGFKTVDESMDVIAFHPDSDFGPTDEDHPMINRTIIGGESAKNIQSIHTR